MAQGQSVAADEAYEVRLAEPSDRDGFLALYEDVWERSRDESWFDWRFLDDPYAAGIEMVVAEREGTLVGAELLLPMPLDVGSERVVARTSYVSSDETDCLCAMFSSATAPGISVLTISYVRTPLRADIGKLTC